MNEHITSNNLYAKRGVKIHRGNGGNEKAKKTMDIHITNKNRESKEDDENSPIIVSSRRFGRPMVNVILCFKMRPRISIRGSVRPSMGLWVRGSATPFFQ